MGREAVSWYWPSWYSPDNCHRSVPFTVQLCFCISIWKWSLSLPCSVLEMTLKLCCSQLSRLWLLRETEVRSICLMLYTGNIIKPINNTYRVDVKIQEVCHSYLWMLLKLDMINKNDENFFMKSLYLTSWFSLILGIRDTGET